MRFACVAIVLGVCSAAIGQEPTVSVLQTQEAPPAAVEVVEVAPAVVEVVAPAPVVVYRYPRGRRACTTPACQLYNVEAATSEKCRRRLFGGFVQRTTSRVVYTPAR